MLHQIEDLKLAHIIVKDKRNEKKSKWKKKKVQNRHYENLLINMIEKYLSKSKV
jgi:hypothetical protein